MPGGRLQVRLDVSCWDAVLSMSASATEMEGFSK